MRAGERQGETRGRRKGSRTDERVGPVGANTGMDWGRGVQRSRRGRDRRGGLTKHLPVDSKHQGDPQLAERELGPDRVDDEREGADVEDLEPVGQDGVGAGGVFDHVVPGVVRPEVGDLVA